MTWSIREEILTALLAQSEANGWSGEIDQSAHINSYGGAHNWRTDEGDDDVSEASLHELLQRDLEVYARRGVEIPRFAAKMIHRFEEFPSVDTLVDAITALRAPIPRPPT